MCMLEKVWGTVFVMLRRGKIMIENKRERDWWKGEDREKMFEKDVERMHKRDRNKKVCVREREIVEWLL